MARHPVLGPDEVTKAARARLLWTWAKTIFGYLIMGGLVLAALVAVNFQYTIGFSILWCLLPVVMWWFSADIALKLQKAVPVDPSKPDDQRLIAIVDKVFPKSGLKYKPKVYIADNPLPNAFATGPIHRKAVVAATKGLFNCGMTDDEIEAVFAHELGHVKNYDVGINSLISVLSSLFFLISDQAVRALLGTIRIFKKDFGFQTGRKKSLFTGILEWIVMYAIFWLTGQITRVVQLFVVRSRESGADATGSLMTLKPCDLSMALQKLVAFVEKNRPKGRDAEVFRVFRPMMTIDPLFDALTPDPKPVGIWGRIKAFWKYLQLTHPPVSERIAELEKMNGGACPRL